MSQDMGNNGPTKRRRAKRASRPCDACRRRKSRCMTRENSTVCSMCELRESACTFLGQSSKITRQRRRNADAEDNADAGNIGDVVAADGPVNLGVGVGGVEHSRPYLNDALPADPISSSEGSLPDAAGAFSAGPAIPRQPSAGNLGSDRHRFAELYGLTSDSEPILMRHRPYSAANHEYCLETHSIRRVSSADNGMAYPVLFHIVADSKGAGGPDDHAAVDTIESAVHPNGPRLVRLYWLLVHPSFPILHQDEFMRQFSVSYKNIHPALLGAIYLKTLAWWSYDSELSLRQAPDETRLRKLTLDAIQSSLHKPRLASAQAMLLYLHSSPERPLNADHTFTRGLASQILAVGEAMGLHLDASDWDIPASEKAVRKRLSWAVYMQDKWAALAYGRPSHITDENWDVRDLSDADFEDESEGLEGLNTMGIDVEGRRSPGKAHFVFMVDLAKILHRVLSIFFTVKSSQNQDTCLLLNQAQPLLLELEAWRQRLLVALPMETGRPRQLCSAGFVHLCYYGVIINMFRRLVRSTALAPLCSDMSVLAAIRQQASQTAHEANNFVASLRMDHLESFWYFASPYLFALVGSFDTLLLVTSISMEERDYWREALTSLLWTLRIMSKASEPMRYAVNRLEGGILRGLQHALAVNVNFPPAAAALPDLKQLLQQFETADNIYSGYPDLGLQSFDWLSEVQI